MCLKQIILILTITMLNISSTFAIEGRTTANVNLRAGPGMNYHSQFIVKKDSKLKILRLADEWCEVEYNGNSGYVYRKFIMIESKEKVVGGFKKAFENISVFFGQDVLWSFGFL